MSKIKFGTDGWRAIISEDFTFENVAVVGQAMADFVKSRREPIYRKRKLVVGYDTRFLSEKYAEIIACVLAANGVKAVISSAPCPTPAVCVYIRDYKLTGGVMVTASHNPPQYNGIKYKGWFGGSAGSDIIDDIEKRLHKTPVKTMSIEEAMKKKLVTRDDITKTQLKAVVKYADMKKLKKARMRVLVDTMFGTGDSHLAEILKDTGIKIDYMNNELNPGFNGKAPEPNEKHLQDLAAGVRKGHYDLGVATDGDADRVGIVDEKGNVLTGHKVMALLLLHLLENRGKRGGVIQTICGTGLIKKICKEYGLKHYETPVGFKYICELMYTKDVLIGGEETGGIGFKGYIPERDGFLSALLIIELMLARKKKLSAILADVDKKYGSYVYERLDFVFPESKRKSIMDGIRKKPLSKVLGRKVVETRHDDGTKFICDDGSWLLLRLSGTEPKLRIYSETSSKAMSQKYLEFGKKYALTL